jgi:ribosomal-protein-serine acetyltransferase
MRVPKELLERDDVRLRRWQRSDAATVHRIVIASLDHLAPWMPWAEAGYGRGHADEYLARCDDDWIAQRAFNYAIIAADSAMVGSCGMMARIGPGALEIGYWLRHDYTGQGIATRAAAALTDEAFRIGADRVEIHHHPANTGSAAVARRLGFVEVPWPTPAPQPGEAPERTTAVQEPTTVWRRTRDAPGAERSPRP